MAIKTEKRKVRVLCPLPEVYKDYQPEVGAVYEADYKMAKCYKCGQTYSPVCVIQVKDKSICLRNGEYEFAEVE